MADQNNEYYVELDVGSLCVNKIVKLKSSLGSAFTETELQHVAAHGTAQLLKEIFKLPSSYHDHVPVGKLPEPTTVLPREKPVPKDNPMTKWENFAKAKGITKKKKEKLAWNETSKDWKPTYGYRSAKNDKDNNWMMEVPDNADPNEDCFGKAKKEKRERVAKNEYQRLRNIATASKVKVTNLESVDHADKQQLSRSLTAAKTATASLGKFTERLSKEKPPKNAMKKRKFKPNIGDVNKEKENNLLIFENLEKKAPKLNIQEAVQSYMTKPLKEGRTEEQVERKNKKRSSKKNKFIKNLFRGGKNNKKVFNRPV